MKAQLLVNLKISTGETIFKGKTFDDEVAPFPDFVTNNLDDSRIIKVTKVVKPVTSDQVKTAVRQTQLARRHKN